MGKTKTPLERQQRWAERVKEQFSITPEQEIAKNMYIAKQTWMRIKQDNAKQDKQDIPEEITQIRTTSKLPTLMRERPSIEEWIARPYAHYEISGT